MAKKITKKILRRLEKKERNKLDKEWKEKVKAEFNDRCAILNCRETKRLNCHHIFPKEDKRFRHEPLNGILLCANHHKFSLEISPHKNPMIFFDFYAAEYPEKYNKLMEIWQNKK